MDSLVLDVNAYTSICKSNENLRNAIYKAYGKKCFYCGEKINMHQLEIDHIIPNSDKEIPNTIEYQRYIEELTNTGLVKDCIANFLPSCRHCNNQKSSKYLSIGNLRFFHEQALNHVDKVIKHMEKYKYSIEDSEKDKKAKELCDGKEYLFEKTIIESSFQCCYAYGLGEVRVNAFLPVSIEDELSCLILLKQSGLADCMFSYDEAIIKSVFFEGYKMGVNENRNFIWYVRENDVAIKFPNNRFVSDLKTTEQLSNIFDDLYDEFYKRKSVLLETIGATYFDEVDKGEFAIIKLPRDIWIAMVDFAQVHNHFVGSTKWDIFKPLNLITKNQITIYRNHLSEDKADIYAELFVKDLSETYVEVVWKAGYTPMLRYMEGFDNIIKWRVDFTHDWILNDFIPYIFFLNVPDDRNIIQHLYKKKITYEDFKKVFNTNEFGIESLYLRE